MIFECSKIYQHALVFESMHPVTDYFFGTGCGFLKSMPQFFKNHFYFFGLICNIGVDVFNWDIRLSHNYFFNQVTDKLKT